MIWIQQYQVYFSYFKFLKDINKYISNIYHILNQITTQFDLKYQNINLYIELLDTNDMQDNLSLYQLPYSLLSFGLFCAKNNTLYIKLDVLFIYLCRKSDVNFNITQQPIPEYPLNFYLTLSEFLIYEILFYTLNNHDNILEYHKYICYKLITDFIIPSNIINNKNE